MFGLKSYIHNRALRLSFILPARVQNHRARACKLSLNLNMSLNTTTELLHIEGEGAVPYQPLNSPAAWTAAEMWARQEEWKHPLTPSDVEELSAAADDALAADKPLHCVTKDDIKLPTMGPKLESYREEAVKGRGFVLVTGVPVEQWSREKTVAAYWIIGLFWGKAKSNNKQGHLVGHIKDIGHDPNAPDTRLYATSLPQPYHNDGPADLVSLLCLHNAKKGGTSHWSSSIAVHNAIVTRRPELAPVLSGPWFFDRKGEIPKGKKPYFEIPVFNYHAGYLSVNFSSNYYFLSQRHEDVPRLTAVHLEAIKVFEEYAQSDEFRMDYILQPGDIQLLSNHTVLHSREGFVDDEEDTNKRRHLLRLWLSPPDERPLPKVYEEIMGGPLVVGDRGGIICDNTLPHIAFEAEEGHQLS